MTFTRPVVVATNDGGVLRQVAAVVTAIVIVAVLTGLADMIVQRLLPSRFYANGHTTDTLVLCLMLVYVTAFSFLGGSVAATVARRNVRTVIYVLAALQLAFGAAAAVKLSAGMPAWWTALSTLLPVITILIGGLAVSSRAT
jgi:nitrate reductase gamma subunit